LSAIRIEPFFLDGPRGPLFCLHVHPEATPAKRAFLYLHPFAEEMHKSRRMAALAARALAGAGHAVLQVDLSGCGDSWGDFEDATWEAWRDDARAAHDWLAERHAVPLTLWGLRTGATLAVDMAERLSGVDRLLLWQPVANGEMFLNQFLRIRLAGEMLADGKAQTGVQALRQQLAAGTPIEVGGYMLNPALANGLAGMQLNARRPGCATHWLEVGARPGEQTTPASQRVIEAWRADGVPVSARTVLGEAFWVTQEITECPALIEATLETT
jgi:exosortase A-associated hydrolase 2